MRSTADLLALSTTLLYVIAATSYLAFLLGQKERLARMATAVLWLGLLVHLLTIGERWRALGLTPVAGPGEALSLFALFLTAVYLALQLRFRRPVLGAFVVPVASLAMVGALLLPRAGEVPEALRSSWLPLHISMAFLGDAVFAVAAASAVAYLIMEHRVKRKEFGGVLDRLPSLDSLDRLNYDLVRLGFALLSMAILTGTLWAGRVWHSYFSWEPRQVTAMLAWLLYGVLIFSRVLAGWRGRRAALITLTGFLLMAGTFLGLKILDIGRHGGTFT